MLAVIKTGGKQYLVSPNDKIKIEKIDKKEGEKIIFDKVLLFSKEDKIEIGKPFIKNRKVIAEVIKQGKGKKIIILKFKRKTRYKVKRGYRHPFTEVQIIKIE